MIVKRGNTNGIEPRNNRNNGKMMDIKIIGSIGYSLPMAGNRATSTITSEFFAHSIYLTVSGKYIRGVSCVYLFN
jgi:hypothetical protein